MASEAGKGSRYRPTDKNKFDNGWDRIFRNKKTSESNEKDSDKRIADHSDEDQQ